MSYKVNVEVESQINELFVKTIVTQKFKNPEKNPLELKIDVYKKEGIIFSSFTAKIGDSVQVKSKVIKKEKAEEKYTDSIAEGNAAIYVYEDPSKKDRVIINMGNIPPNQEVIFTSEFLHLLESSKTYEFELFRSLPVFHGDKNSTIYQNDGLKGQITFHTKNKIYDFRKEFLLKSLIIKEEKYLNEDTKNEYLITYAVEHLPNLTNYEFENVERATSYIPSSKIFFNIENSEDDAPIIFKQNSSIDDKESNYILQYKIPDQLKEKGKEDEENLEVYPALFIFLVDQSGSMSGQPIKIVSKAMQLFLQSLPAGSYYQIIGFGSSYKKYDEEPKEYTRENIKKSIEFIQTLRADLGGTDIYSPLSNIYDSLKVYEKIKLPKNIFLLTDGEIDSKDTTLKLIERNSSQFAIFSIGIGNDFDKDLIKNAGLIGKGGYNFCQNMDNLNSVIVSEIERAVVPFYSNFALQTSLNTKNLYKNTEAPSILRKNELISFQYITAIDKDNIDKEKIDIQINYCCQSEGEKNFEKKYEITPIEVPTGEELSKLIISEQLLRNTDLKSEEQIKLALKYQIFTKDTSLFAEVELSQKITEEMKSKIIEEQENKAIYKEKPKLESIDFLEEHVDYCMKANACDDLCYARPKKAGIFSSIGKKIKGLFSFGSKSKQSAAYLSRACCEDRNVECCCECEDDGDEEYCCSAPIDFDNGAKFEDFEAEKKDENKKIDINSKDNVMKIVNTQDVIEGFWEENAETKPIKEKYIKEFELLKGLKDKNISDNVALTIIIIYFINKEYPSLLSELSMIIKKAKLFIKKETKDTYENIIKEIGIN